MTCAALAISAGLVVAQTAPDAGRLLQQTQPPSPSPQPGTRLIPEQAGEVAPTSDSTPVRVKSFKFEGNQVFSSEQLAALLADQQGQSVPFGQLRASLARIQAAYSAKGYFLARAIIPRQDLGAGTGVLRIQVLEGRLGQIKSDLQGGEHAMAQESLRAQGIELGVGLQQAPLERSLLLIGDRLGVDATVALSPGEKVGTTDVSLQLPALGKAWNVQLSLDNGGNRYTGVLRALADVNLRHLATVGDSLQLRAQLAKGIGNFTLGYSAPIGHQGLRIDAQVSRLNYELCCQFVALQSRGSASQWSVNLRYPLVLIAQRSIHIEGGYSRRHSQDESLGIIMADKLVSPAQLALSFNDSHAYDGRLLQNGRLAYVRGQLDQRVTPNPNLPKRYSKVQANYAATYFASDSQWLFKANGQAAQSKLDSSEKLILGGPNGVRGWPVGEASGDQGVILTAEWRKALKSTATAAQGWTLSIFSDVGQVTQQKRPSAASLPAGQSNQYVLSSVGAGLSYRATGWALSTQLAKGLGRNEGASAAGLNSDGRKRNTQLWMSLTSSF